MSLKDLIRNLKTPPPPPSRRLDRGIKKALEYTCRRRYFKPKEETPSIIIPMTTSKFRDNAYSLKHYILNTGGVRIRREYSNLVRVDFETLGDNIKFFRYFSRNQSDPIPHDLIFPGARVVHMKRKPWKIF